MNRRINAAGLSLVKQWEGLKTKAYQDVAGVWTIGYGHTSTAGAPVVKPGMVITEASAEEILRADLAVFEERVSRLVKVPLNDNQHAALVSFDFNTGALGKSTLLKKLNAGNYDAVPAELMKWVHAGGKRVKGLVNRRSAEAGLWAKGATAPTAPTTGGFWAALGRFLLALIKGGKK
ncbi:Lysozyme RrrD [Ensifer sp. M14]|nr:Lysozyme RrrD [Ensifer sp. M14]